MERLDIQQDGKANDTENPHSDGQEHDIFSAEEIEIEEMTIDGICGVY